MVTGSQGIYWQTFYVVKLRSKLSLVKGLVGTSLFTLELEAFIGVCGEYNISSSGFYLKINSASQVFGEILDLSCFSYKQHAFNHVCLVVTIYGIPGLIQSHSLLHSTRYWLAYLCSPSSMYP